MERYWQQKPEELWENAVPTSFYPRQIPPAVAWDRTWASAMICLRLTAWTVLWLSVNRLVCVFTSLRVTVTAEENEISNETQNWALPEKLIVGEVIEKFPTFWYFITAFTWACHLSLSLARWIQCLSSTRISWSCTYFNLLATDLFLNFSTPCI